MAIYCQYEKILGIQTKFRLTVYCYFAEKLLKYRISVMNAGGAVPVGTGQLKPQLRNAVELLAGCSSA